jgi:hypothetical protein
MATQLLMPPDQNLTVLKDLQATARAAVLVTVPHSTEALAIVAVAVILAHLIAASVTAQLLAKNHMHVMVNVVRAVVTAAQHQLHAEMAAAMRVDLQFVAKIVVKTVVKLVALQAEILVRATVLHAAHVASPKKILAAEMNFVLLIRVYQRLK